MSSSDLPKRRGQAVRPAAGDGVSVYEPETDGLHILNSSAFAIWELCDGKTTPQEIAAAISELTGVALPDASADVARTLETLERLSLIGPQRNG